MRAKAKQVEMQASGVSISQWSRDNSFSRAVVAAVLAGRCSCLRGEAHAVAVALGIKDGIVIKPGTYYPVKPAVDARQLRKAA